MGTLQWVGHEDVRRRDVRPATGWKRFEYKCNGHLTYIYCLSHDTFIKLFEQWSRWGDKEHGPFTYTLTGAAPVEMHLEDIVMDRPEGAPYRCKLYLHTQHGEYIQ